MTVMQQFVFNEEMARGRAPRPGGIGVGFAGPAIITCLIEEAQAPKAIRALHKAFELEEG